MFIHTGQIDQQFEITRLRALETGRYVLVAATNGVSGVIAPDGTVLDRADPRTQAVLVEEIGLSTSLTPRSGSGRGSTGPAWPSRWSRCCWGCSRIVGASAARGGREPHEQSESALGRIVMVVPTYNEADNITWIVGRLRAGAARRRRARRRRQLARRHRPDRRPSSRPTTPRCRCCTARPRTAWARRTSHGFAVALDAGYDVIGEMDADGSHQPEQLHRLLDRAGGRRPGDRVALGARAARS